MLERIGDRPAATTIANGGTIAIEVLEARRFAWIEGAIGADEALTVAYQVPGASGAWVTLGAPLALTADTADTFVFRSTGLQARVLVTNGSGALATLSTFEVNGRTEA
jgi:hypothetical protein